MKILNAVKQLIDIMTKYGNLDVNISLLSENGDIDIEDFKINTFYNKLGNKKVCITYDINDVKKFKQLIKDKL